MKRIIPIERFASAFRRFPNTQAFLFELVAVVAEWASVARAGIFLKDPVTGVFRMNSGVRCLPVTQALEVSEADRLVTYLTTKAHMISQASLAHISDVDERLGLMRALADMGATAIVPLFGRQQLNGWLFLGEHASGLPFGDDDWTELASIAQITEILVDDALLHESTAVQKALGENLLGSLPIGVIALDSEGKIGWYNELSEQLLGRERGQVVQQHVSKLDKRIADLLLRCLDNSSASGYLEYEEPRTGRPLAVTATPLQTHDNGLGAVALLRDLTGERRMREMEGL